jgi:predicted restriction endonuclease
MVADESPQLCGIDKTNMGFVATSSFIKDAHIKPDDIGNSLSLVCHCPSEVLTIQVVSRAGKLTWL